MATAFLALLSFVALVWLAIALSPAHRATFRHLLMADTPVEGGGPLPPVSIVVPARNEAPVLSATVPTYCTQDYPDVQVVLVNDQSEDDSAAVLARLRADHANLTVIDATPRPDGWCGKPWAVTQGVAAARADWLLFTDADCHFHPRVTRQAVRFMQANDLDLLSLVPQMTFGSAVERVGLAGLVTVLAMMFPVGWANDPKRTSLALAAGGFILVRRSAYEKTGGHAAVKSQLIEDVNLARKMKAEGAKVHVRFTPDLVSTRMYEGWGDLWEGLAKNAYAGMEYQPHKFWVGIVVGLLVSVLPPAYLLASVLWAAAAPESRAAQAAVVLASLINLLIVLVHLRAVRFLRLPLWHALLMPLSAGLYTLIAISSAWQHHYRGGNLWKGRRYTREMLLAPPEPATADPRPQ